MNKIPSQLKKTCLHPVRLTWNLRIHPIEKENHLNQTIVFRFQLLYNLQGCTWMSQEVSKWVITPIYPIYKWGYNPLILTSWDIQVSTANTTFCLRFIPFCFFWSSGPAVCRQRDTGCHFANHNSSIPAAAFLSWENSRPALCSQIERNKSILYIYINTIYVCNMYTHINVNLNKYLSIYICYVYIYRNIESV